MSVDVLFSLSIGLTEEIIVPAGTYARICAHLAEIERTLDIAPKRHGDHPASWNEPVWDELDADEACSTVNAHNAWVQKLYDNLARWAKEPPSGDVEAITPAQASTFWHGTRTLEVPPAYWNRDHFVRRMEDAYEVMRGRPSGRLTWPGGRGGKPLTPQQAANVLWLFAQLGYDPDDIRLAVPRGCDRIASCDDWGYEWCETCGAVEHETGEGCRRRGCAYRERLRGNN